MEKIRVKKLPKNVKQDKKIKLKLANEYDDSEEIFVKPKTLKKLIRAKNKDAGKMIQLDEEEISENIEGGSLLGTRFDRNMKFLLGKPVYKKIHSGVDKYLQPYIDPAVDLFVDYNIPVSDTLVDNFVKKPTKFLLKDALKNPGKYDLTRRIPDYIYDKIASNKNFGQNKAQVDGELKAAKQAVRNSEIYAEGRGLYAGKGLYAGSGLYASSGPYMRGSGITMSKIPIRGRTVNNISAPNPQQTNYEMLDFFTNKPYSVETGRIQSRVGKGLFA